MAAADPRAGAGADPAGAPLGRLTRAEALTLLAIAAFAELLSVGWIGALVGADARPESWGQALTLAGLDLVSLVLVPPAVFAAYDRWPPAPGAGARRALAPLAARGAAAALVALAQALLSRRLLLWAGPAVGLGPSQMDAVLGGAWEALFWGGLVIGASSLAYFVLRRLRLARTLAGRHAALRAAAVEAQLAALSAELRPHFLFNALNDLAELVHHDPARAEAMLLHLSSLLRATLAAGRRPTVPLAEELAHVDDYLALQSLRFGDRLRVTRDVAPEALAARVPAMLLQPLVENALVHGAEGRPGAAHVALAARVAADAGVLELVVDDGPGPGGRAGARAEARAGARAGTGTGLRNVRERLAALYGGAATVALGAGPAGGARAVVRLPLGVPDVSPEAAP